MLKVIHKLLIFTNNLKLYIIILLLPFITKAIELELETEPSGSCEGQVPGTIPNPIEACTFEELVEDITEIILMVGLPLAAIMIIFAGYQFVTAQGNDQKIKDARQTFYWAIIGAAVIVGARVIAGAVVNFAQDLG